MNQREVEKHLVFQVSFIAFLIVTILFTIFYLLTEEVKADTGYTTIDITSSIRDTSRCTSSIGSGYFCAALTSQSSWVSTATAQNNLGYYPLSFEFSYQNTNMYTLTNSTIALISYDNQFKNISYSCTISGVSDCRVVYSNSSRLNINFTTPSNTNRMTIFVTANGNNIARGDYFGIKEVRFIQPKTTDSTNTDIIQSNNENTEKVIDNNNKNTQDIIQQVQDLIANNEELQQQLIEAQQCPTGPLTLTRDEWGTNRGYVLASDGSLTAMSGNDISPYLIVKPNTEYQLITTGGSINSSLHYCFYNSSKTIINCSSYASGNTATNTFTTTQYVQYMRISIQGSRTFTLKGPVCNDWQKEAQEKLGDIALDTNSYLKDDSNPNINDSAISNTLESVAIDDPLNYLLTLPLHTIQRINYHLSNNSCSSFNLGNLYGTDLVLPCLNIKRRLGDSLFNIIDILMAIGLGSITLKKFYDSISNVLTLGKEKEVREKLELPTPMEFFAMIFGGGR